MSTTNKPPGLSPFWLKTKGGEWTQYFERFKHIFFENHDSPPISRPCRVMANTPPPACLVVNVPADALARESQARRVG